MQSQYCAGGGAIKHKRSTQRTVVTLSQTSPSRISYQRKALGTLGGEGSVGAPQSPPERRASRCLFWDGAWVTRRLVA